MATEMQNRRNQQQNQQQVQQQDQGKQQASVSKSGNIVRALRSAERSQRNKSQQKNQERTQHEKEVRASDARDNRLALNRQNEAVRVASVRQTDANRVAVRAQGAQGQENALENGQNRDIEARTVPGEVSQDVSAELKVVQGVSQDGPDARRATEASVEPLATGPGTEVGVETERPLADLISTPSRFGGLVARDSATRGQIEGFIEFLTSTFQKKKEAVDPVEEAFSILRWAIMLEAIGELAQKFILESAAAAGFSAEAIREMVANAVRILESKDIADEDFVAMLEEELDIALDSSAAQETEESAYKFEAYEEEDKPKTKPGRVAA